MFGRGKKHDTELSGPDMPNMTRALAKTIAAGDVVGFRLLFQPSSPAREGGFEDFSQTKYAFLLPSDEERQAPGYMEALRLCEDSTTQSHVEAELRANRPARMPAQLLMLLADNAVRLGKYSFAAQAYEILRVRGKIQALFFGEASSALDRGDINGAVHTHIIAQGLAFDYAAFPEPLPSVPAYQKDALMMHGQYVDTRVAGDESALVAKGLTYMLRTPEAATELEARPLDVQRAFLAAFIQAADNDWSAFAARYREACAALMTARQKAAGIQKNNPNIADISDLIAETIGDEMRQLAPILLGRTLHGGEWWQYVKELGYEHPGSALFLVRAHLGGEDLLLPEEWPGMPLLVALDLCDPVG